MLTLNCFSLSSFCLACLLNIIALIGTTLSHAQNLVVGVEDVSYYPYFDYTASETSFSKTVLDKFGADNGHTITYLPLPIKQFSKWLYENDIDFKFPDNQRWQDSSTNESKAAFFSNDIIYLRAGTVVLAENKTKPHSFFKNLGKISGFDSTLLNAEFGTTQVSIFDDTSAKVLVKHLANGLIDGVDLDIVVAKFYLDSLGIAKPLAYSTVLRQEIFGYQLSTLKYPEIIEQFNQWLSQNTEFIATTQRLFTIPEESLVSEVHQ